MLASLVDCSTYGFMIPASHGIFVPLFVLLVLYRQRQRLHAIQSSPSWMGSAVVVLGLLVLALGVLSRNLFLSRISLLIVLAGLIALRRMGIFSCGSFSLGFFGSDDSHSVLGGERLILLLESLSAKLAGSLFQLSGVSVSLEGGNVLLLPDGVYFLICTGGSLLSLLAVAIMYAYLADRRTWLRVLLTILVVPIKVVCGSFVIVIAALLAAFTDSVQTLEFIRISGWVSFVMALLMLFILHYAIAFIWKRTRPPAAFSQLKPAQA